MLHDCLCENWERDLYWVDCGRHGNVPGRLRLLALDNEIYFQEELETVPDWSSGCGYIAAVE